MNKPSFFLIGAGKSGTTSLVYYLAQHPNLMVSDPKEPVFFQTEYQQGLAYYWDKYFRGYSGEKHAGEAAHQNSRLPYVAKRIHESCPNAKILMICRQPVDRAFSAYWHNAVRKIERRSFEDAIQENLDRLQRGPTFETEDEAEFYAQGVEQQRKDGQVRHASYVDSGYYARHLERYAALFGKDNIKVVFFEDLAQSPQATADRIWQFLGLNSVPVVDEAAQNTTASPALATLTNLAFKIPGVQNISPAFRAKVRQRLAALMPGKKPKMSPQTRQDLIAHFAPENAHLEQFTGRPLAHWNH